MKKMDLKVFVETDVKDRIEYELKSGDNDLQSTDLYDDQDEYDEAVDKGEINNTMSIELGNTPIFVEFLTDEDAENASFMWYGASSRIPKIVRITYVEINTGDFNILIDPEKDYEVKIETDLTNHVLKAEDNN